MSRVKVNSNQHTYDFLHPVFEDKAASPETAHYSPQAPYATQKAYQGTPTKAQRYALKA